MFVNKIENWDREEKFVRFCPYLDIFSREFVYVTATCVWHPNNMFIHVPFIKEKWANIYECSELFSIRRFRLGGINVVSSFVFVCIAMCFNVPFIRLSHWGKSKLFNIALNNKQIYHSFLWNANKWEGLYIVCWHFTENIAKMMAQRSSVWKYLNRLRLSMSTRVSSGVFLCGFLAFEFCRFCVVIRFFHPRHIPFWMFSVK